jgi:hypothetical protein
MLQHGHDDVDDDPGIGCPSTSTSDANFECVREVIGSERSKSVDQIASDVGISVGSCHSILHDVLNMRHVFSAFATSCADKDNNFLNIIITGDETWRFLYEIQEGNLFNGNHHFNLKEESLNLQG